MKIVINNKLELTNVPNMLVYVISKDLTVDNPVYKEAEAMGRYTRNIPPVIKNFSVDHSGKYYLPRGYIGTLLKSCKDLNIITEIEDIRSVNFLSKEYTWDIKLRDYQKKALNDLTQYFEGVLVAPAGSGKTVMGISLIAMSNQKCLWITHTKQLLTQFITRLKQFSNITDEDIGIIQAGTWDTNKQIVVGMVQTLIRDEEAISKIKDNFGIVIADECHHAPSTTFTKVIASLNPLYLYGLTATPVRRDGLTDIMLQILGPIRHVTSRKNIASKLVTPIVVPRKINQNKLSGNTYQELLKELVENENRNNIIAKDVVTEASIGNMCIVTTERVAHVEILYNIISKLWKKTGVIIGKSKDSERDKTLAKLETREITVLICTSHILGEGFDHPSLNRLFMALPFRSLVRCEQLVGRIQRSAEGKKDAKIYDYIDNHGLAKNQYRNFTGKGCRYAIYKKLGCTIEKPW